jgi:eukaryotic-like serine/threonine-protein kinase
MTSLKPNGALPEEDLPSSRPPRLNSWKEIAAYFDRDVRTVQLWEKNEALPVHRLGHVARSTVYAYPHELERWLAGHRGATTPPAPVEEPQPAPPQPATAQPRGRNLLRWTAAVALALLAAAGLLTWKLLHPRRPAAEISVVLADFVNTTGDPANDNALNIALLAKLQQTPFLVFMPPSKIQLALSYMGRPSTERLNLAVAREVCLREGGQVVLQGSIAGSAPDYAVTLRALRCADAKLLALRSSTADSGRSVLRAIDQTAEALRPALGESAASIRTYNVSVTDATTASLDALLVYSQGDAVWNAQGEDAALPYFQRAIQIDPNFALAYERLGTIYGNRGDSQHSHEAVRRAWDLRDRVTERERFYVNSHLYGFVTGEIEKEMGSYLEWSKVYPHDTPWMVDLSIDYSYMGQFAKAIELQRRLIQENPGISYSYGDLAGFYLAEDRPDEARAVLDEAAQNHVQDPNIQLANYDLAFYRNDLDALDKMVAAAHQPGVEDLLLTQQAMTQDSLGRIASGRAFALRAAAVAAAAHESEIQANWLTAESVRQAEIGDPRQARTLLAAAMALPATRTGRNALLWSAQAYTLLRESRPAQALIDILNRDYPLDTLIQSYWLPILRARIAFGRSQYDEALRLTGQSNPYDLGIFSPGQCMDLSLLRGQVLLADGQASAAAQQFRAILAHRGLVLNCPTVVLARLGLARAFAATGQVAAGRSAYQDLFALWKNADADLPILRQAQAEYRSLPSLNTTTAALH